MNIAVDIGNTSFKYGKFENSEFIESGHVKKLEELFQFSKEDNLVLSSVVLNESQLTNLKAHFQSPLFINNRTPFPFDVDYETPHTLGVDRLAAAAGAQLLNPKGNSLIIDLGTCITYDILKDGDLFQGGMISPGKRIRFKAMNDYTANLPDLSNTELITPEIPSKSTKKAMISGVVIGLITEINGIIEEYQDKYEELTVYMCGGDADFFERKLKHSIFVDSNLVLKGLNHILLYNKEVHG